MTIPVSNKEGCLNYVKGYVEKALKTTSVAENLSLSHLKGQVSVYPERVGPNVNAESLQMKCQPFSWALKEALVGFGLQVQVVSTGNRSVAEHVYLVARIDREGVIIEPTIGQIILGHNHIFVGFRCDLRKIVVDNIDGPNSPYQIAPPYTTYHQKYPEEIFRHFWGDESRPFP